MVMGRKGKERRWTGDMSHIFIREPHMVEFCFCFLDVVQLILLTEYARVRTVRRLDISPFRSCSGVDA